MKYKLWVRANWDIVLGGILPLSAFAVFWVFNILGLLTGWVGLGVFAFTAWISMFLSLFGLSSSILRGRGFFNLRNLWFVPGLVIFALTIGVNSL
ncbi:MAG: hypothetical protein ACLFN8_03300 [Candidatus Woesearchaeota archaeon]